MSAKIIDWLLGGGAVAIVGMLAWFAKWRVQVLQAQNKHTREATFLSHLGEVIRDVVAEVTQTYVDGRKASGTWDDKARQIARAKAYATVREYLGIKGWAMLGWLLSTDDSTTLESYLSTRIEAAVRDVKLETGAIQTLAAAGAPNPPEASS